MTFGISEGPKKQKEFIERQEPFSSSYSLLEELKSGISYSDKTKVTEYHSTPIESLQGAATLKDIEPLEEKEKETDLKDQSAPLGPSQHQSCSSSTGSPQNSEANGPNPRGNTDQLSEAPMDQKEEKKEEGEESQAKKKKKKKKSKNKGPAAVPKYAQNNYFGCLN